MPMSDEQVQALMQNWHDELKKNMDAMTIRKWCVEQAIKYCEANKLETRAAEFMLVYASILEFITVPIADVLKGSAAEE